MAFANGCVDTIALCANRTPFVRMGQNTTGFVRIQLRNEDTGNPVDLTQYGIHAGPFSSSSSSSGDPDPLPITGLVCYLRETPTSVIILRIIPRVETEEDAQTGIIYIPYDVLATRYAGLWNGQVTIRQDGEEKALFPFYHDIRPNISILRASYPVTIPEIRMAMRDLCADFNFLIDRQEVADEEILYALRRPVNQWNETPPPLFYYSPSTFPYHEHWLRATIGILLRTVAMWMRRNDLDYQAGGVAVADTKKWPDYLKMADRYDEEWRNFIKQAKITENLSGAYAELGGYRYAPYRG